MENKKKIAFFVEKLYGGGVEKILQIILRNFDYEQYDVTLYSSSGEELREDFYPLGIKHYHYFLPNGYGKLQNLWVKVNNKLRLFIYYHLSPSVFYRLFIRKKYDVGIAFIEGYATRILSGAPKSMKKISWVHIELETFPWTKIAYRNDDEEIDCYHQMNKVVCVSKIVKEQADKRFNVSSVSTVIYNPIEQKKIKKNSLDVISPVQKNIRFDYRLISIGTLNKRKGQIRLLYALKQLIDEGYSLELWLLGEGDEKETLLRYIQDNNLLDNISLIGYKDNPYPYLRESDIYVCSSYAEGYNTAITEALVLGKAVVSTECSGVKEQLGEHNEYGICTPNTEEGLYEGIKLMLTGNNLEYYTQQAEIRGKDFSLDNSMKEIYRLIDE